jgi:hypothetical protein
MGRRRRLPATDRDMSRVTASLGALRNAQTSLTKAKRWLELAGCPRATLKVGLALDAVAKARSSTEGAERHMQGRLMDAEAEAEVLGQRQMAFGIRAQD